jgi:fibronectin type 3 domain-containing protein
VNLNLPNVRRASLIRACNNALQQLENRQLMANVVQSLPFSLNFNAPVSGTLLDKNGKGVGLTAVQNNRASDAYQPGLLWLDTASGTLKLTTRGSSLSGSNSGVDNSLVNALETGFNGYQSGFSIETRIVGPLSGLNERFEQVGIYFGPDQDNFVKLVIGRNWNGQFLSFEDEFTNATGGVSSTRNGGNAQTGVGSFASINTLDLRLVGDAATGKLSAYYRVNSDSGLYTKVGYEITIDQNKRSAFFNSASKAGLLAQHKNDNGPITAAFDSFAVKAGTPILARPGVAKLEGLGGVTTNVRRDTTIQAVLSLANGNSALNTATLSAATVKLYRASDAAVIAANLSHSNGVVTITPVGNLDANTTYTVEITSGLKDSAGASFQPFVSSFTTGTASASIVTNVGAVANYSVDKLYFSDISATASNGWGSSVSQTVRITNTGSAALTLASNALQFGGTNASEFALASGVSLPATIKPGAFIDIPIAFTASAVGIRSGTLTITTNDANQPSKIITLRGLGTAGNGGNLEPSLQRILDLYQIPVNVGDPTPDTTDIPAPPTSGETLNIERLVKAGTGPVTIEVLGNFANSVSPSSRFGWYSAGQLVDRKQLFTVAQQYAQMVRPITNGTLSFDPTGAFGLYGEFPAFSGRVVASETFYNTWESNTSRQQKIRFFPLKNADGSTVPNAYVFALEEWTVEFDSNDIVGIIRNVAPAAAGAEVGLVNVDGVPFNDRLVFNRIRDLQVYDPVNNYIPNTVHDTSTLRVTNSGNANLVVSSVSISNSDFTITSGGGAFTLAPGATRDIVVQFVYNQSGFGNTIRTATLTLNTNDADEATKTVTLSGLWQSNSENSPDGVSREPTAQTVLQIYGYNVNVGSLNTFGNAIRAGEEVLSEYWNVADASRTVGVRMLAAFHQQRTTTASHIRWSPQGDTGFGNFLYQHLASDGQSLLPRKNFSTDPAYAEFSPWSSFAWAIDSAWSIDARNTNAYNPAAYPIFDGGHSMRFYAAKDPAGAIIPNTYVLLMDYVGQSFSNYDYQDNIFLLTNVKPASGPGTPSSLQIYPGAGGNALAWGGNTEGNLSGYNIYRSTSAGGPFTKLNSAPHTNTIYTDASALTGVTYYYQVRGVDYHGTEGNAASISGTRTIDNVAPAAPLWATGQGSTTSVILSWLDNTDADLAGYNVYRATSEDGVYVKLNASLLSASGYVDLTAPAAATSYYRVTAVDSTGNESGPSSFNVYRPATGAVPTAPSSLVASNVSTSSITLSWADNSNNETGFIVERRNGDGSWSEIATLGASVTTYTNTGLNGGTTYVYRVRAVNSVGPSGYTNELSATTNNSAPAAPTSLAAAALNANAVRLTWTDNATNETGYRIERRLGASGAWAVLDTVGVNLTLFVDNSVLANTTYNYRVTAINTVGSSAASNVVSVTTPVADGYTSVDIGAPLAGGSTTVVNAGRDYNITAGGTDVWANSDQFRFVYKMLSGDFDYSARVTDVSQTDIGSMAGLMARESLAADARHIYIRARSQGMRTNYRDATAGTSGGVGNTPFTFPNAWVRLQRVGNTFTTYASTDGATWTQMHQMTMAMPPTLFFGMAVSARTTTTATTTAQIRDLTDRKAVSAPLAPDGLVGQSDTTPRVALYWNDNATNEAGYRIERKPAGGDTWASIATLAANATSYLDTSVSLNSVYVYRVVAYNDAGSTASNELTMAVSNGVPTAPSGLALSNVVAGVKLDWIDASSNETFFQIERRLASSGTWTQLNVVNANVTTFTDTSAAAGQSYVYRIRALGAAGDSNYSGEAIIDTPTALGFLSADIGGAGGSTQVVETGNAYDITAAGTDVWNRADQLRFVYRQVSGDFDIRMRVESLAYVSDQTMAGLMARASLDANSRNVFVKGRADGSARMTYRSTTGGTTTGAGSGSVGYPAGWVRLARFGNTFIGYTSTDGVSWTVVSSVTLSLPATMFVGVGVASHVTNVTTTAQIRDLQMV